MLLASWRTSSPTFHRIPPHLSLLTSSRTSSAYAMENLGSQRTLMRRRVEETLDLLDIENLRAQECPLVIGRRASAGRDRRCPHFRGRFLLLDEPTSQLDPQGAEDVLAALQRLVHDLGLTVMIAEHRLDGSWDSSTWRSGASRSREAGRGARHPRLDGHRPPRPSTGTSSRVVTVAPDGEGSTSQPRRRTR